MTLKLGMTWRLAGPFLPNSLLKMATVSFWSWSLWLRGASLPGCYAWPVVAEGWSAPPTDLPGFLRAF